MAEIARTSAVDVTGTGLEAVVVDPEAIEAIRSLAEGIDRLRRQAIRKAEDSIEFLKQALGSRPTRRPGREDGGSGTPGRSPTHP